MISAETLTDVIQIYAYILASRPQGLSLSYKEQYSWSLEDSNVAKIGGK
jgi:hypothetical protein